MPSHFSTIGVPVETEDDFYALANRVADDAETIDVPGGRYLYWSDTSGAELWLQLNLENELVGMNPHFVGESQLKVGIASQVLQSEDYVLDGAYQGWADPEDEDVESGLYPFVFDTPDFQCHNELTVPTVSQVQIAAFAHELSLFDSEEDYAASQTEEIKFASQSFIPAGMFADECDPAVAPTALAVFTGTVIQTERYENGLTGCAFHWALVESLGGSFDVVMDPELLERVPRVGGILSGTFWLSGRVT